MGPREEKAILESVKDKIPASGLAVFPKTGHVLNLEEPALFNQTLERFLILTEAGRWPPRDLASRPRSSDASFTRARPSPSPRCRASG